MNMDHVSAFWEDISKKKLLCEFPTKISKGQLLESQTDKQC